MKTYHSDIFDFTTVKTPAGQGSLLVSEPFLRERYFMHAVVSLIDVPQRTGSMGVVLNNRTALMLDEVMDNIDAARKINVYCGGPVSQDRLFFVHTLGDIIIPQAQQYAPGLWVGGDFDAIADYINSGYPIDGCVRFFVGYSGWDPGQLQAELDNNVWAVAANPAVTPAELLTLHGDALWHRVIRSMGPSYRRWQLHPMSLHAN